MNIELRDEILGPYFSDPFRGDIAYFADVPLAVLERLITFGFVDMDKWNDCAGVRDLFLPFMKRHPEFRAHGYAISKERPDCRITIEGLCCHQVMKIPTLIDFFNTFRGADEIDMQLGYASCWYD